MFQQEKNIFFFFSSCVITIITVISLSLLNEKIWLILFAIWFFIVTLYRVIKRAINLKKDSNNKENKWFYLILDIILTINATFKEGVDTMISNYNIIKNAIPASIFVALIGLASAGLSQVMAEMLGSLGLGIGPGAIIYATYCYVNAEKKVWNVYGRGIQ